MSEIAEVKEQKGDGQLVVAAPQRGPMTLAEVVGHVGLVQQVMKTVMKEGEHYGVIPGTSGKPSLLKAGAEKLSLTFKLRPKFTVTMRDLGKGHREYEVVCDLYYIDGTHEGQGVGSCSTMESKYRYRSSDRACPKCGKPAIIKGKAEYGGGWLCFAKRGGCGAKFLNGDQTIEGQATGKVEHDNPADFYNTALKMGKKRAHVDATLTATAASDIFTQDIEDQESPPTKPKPASDKMYPKQSAQLKTKLEELRNTYGPAFDALLPEGTGIEELVKLTTSRAAAADIVAELTAACREAVSSDGDKEDLDFA